MIESVEALLVKVLFDVEAPVSAIALAPAKRARARLCRTVASALELDPESDNVVRAAVSLELIHLASLLHDDVIDGARVRRGQASANACVGNTAAVLIGDELLCRALALVDRSLLPSIVDAIRRMTRGALAEEKARGDVALDLPRWRRVAQDKTGALFSLACGIPAALARAPAEVAARLSLAGEHLGIAFQALDDLEDLRSGQDLADKTPNAALAAAFSATSSLPPRVAGAWARAHRNDAELGDLAREACAVGERAVLGLVRNELAQAQEAFGRWVDVQALGRGVGVPWPAEGGGEATRVGGTLSATQEGP
ncbi:MAG: polyprenyl synthetase family protein [Deltaproteobacteria bacterium]|nr:polyprenyl synthetase family protein [Deltaproteobacteria bacterium]